jgi:ATP-dependent RNA circularization protein (DNA/RNA ligase family)
MFHNPIADGKFNNFDSKSYEYNKKIIKENDWCLLEKVKGANLRFCFKDKKISISTYDKSSLLIKEDELRWLKNFISKKLTQKFCKIFKEGVITFSGVLIGPSIYSNLYNQKDFDLYIFDVKDETKDCYLSFKEMTKAIESVELKGLPLIKCGSFEEVSKEMKVNYKSIINSEIEMQGFVCKTENEVKRSDGERFVFGIDSENLINNKEVGVRCTE